MLFPEPIFCFDGKMRARLYTFARVNFPPLRAENQNLFWATKHLKQFPAISLRGYVCAQKFSIHNKTMLPFPAIVIAWERI